jgi:cysteinyl-tRNA synthetase
MPNYPLPISLFDSYRQEFILLDPEKTVIKNTLKYYSCGPTIYSYQHIGNLRAAWFPTTLQNLAQMAGWKVELVFNITDVGHLTGDNEGDADTGEDRMEKAVKKEQKKVQDIVDFYLQDYYRQCQALNIELPTDKYFPKATQYIKEQMILALELLQDGRAYILEDGIYFDSISDNNKEILSLVNAFAGMPKTDGNNSEFNKRDIKNTTKNPNDFALWKFVTENTVQKWRICDFMEETNTTFSKEILDIMTSDSLRSCINEIEYESLEDCWGCPGWHSECVAMITAILGENKQAQSTTKQQFSFKNYVNLIENNSKNSNENYLIDLHSGGIEHIPIHHKNEIIQAEALNLHLSRYWTHWKHVLINDKKMSKSLGNVILVTGKKEVTGFDSIEELGFDSLAYRLMLFEHHYQENLNFTLDKLQQSQNRLYNLRKNTAKIQSFIDLGKSSSNNNENNESTNEEIKTKLLETGLNNLNYSKMLEQYEQIVTSESDNITKNNSVNTDIYQLLKDFDQNFFKLDLFYSSYNPIIIEKAQQRQIEKQNKNWTESDKLRNEILMQNWQIDDYKWGYGLWKTK